MSKYIATKKFKELGIEESYQGLNTDDYFSFLAGKEVDLKEVPKKLLNGYIEKVEKVKKGVK